MGAFAHAHYKWPNWYKTRSNWQNLRFCNKPGTGNLILDNI